MARNGCKISIHVLILILCVSKAIWALPTSIVINDGKIHNFNDPALWMGTPISFYNNVNYPYNPTTANFNVQVRATVSAYQDSLIFAHDASINSIWLYDNSYAFLTGSSQSVTFIASGNSNLIVAGNYVSEDFGLRENSNAKIFGDIELYSSAIRDNAILTSYGLLNTYFFNMYGNSVLNSYGPKAGGLGIHDNATAVLYADAFNLPFGTYTNLGVPWFFLDAFYADGTNFTSGINLEEGGTLILEQTPVPEPSTIILAAICVIGFAVSRRRR